MLHKSAKPKFINYIKKGAVIFFVAEAFAFAGSYFVWHKLNTERGFRLYMRDNFPVVLDSFYTFSERFGANDIRRVDSTFWEKTGRKSADRV